ncbi:hypothetical protein [Winogradskyella sp. UBA3174]|uniref:hypothetical protein n=1 Tax=Winogradskyella sp. UBA3174 TaxID=1947785 RepID=UPI0025F88DEB|nr:hypothetical protein [Winogradskyella sp. UBA3174]|tara:strand:+ start:15778 stop:16593 length:816 start_codon:yes stop_codon:yes gene_type:complete
MKVIIAIVVIIALTILIVWLIDKFVPKKLKPFINIALWALIIFLGYMTFMSVYKDIQFNQLKDKRYKAVIERLIEVRDTQLAYKEVNREYADSFDKLVRFVDSARVPITQRRDSTILDEERTKAFGGVETMKTITLIDTLSYYSVKDSLWKGSDRDRYKKMMNVFSDSEMTEKYSEWAEKLPSGNKKEQELKKMMKEGSKFIIKAGKLDDISVFECNVDKRVVLFDQDKYLIDKEKEAFSVAGVKGPTVKIGSMEEVNTNGNWGKDLSNKQ